MGLYNAHKENVMEINKRRRNIEEQIVLARGVKRVCGVEIPETFLVSLVKEEEDLRSMLSRERGRMLEMGRREGVSEKELKEMEINSLL